LLPASNSDKIMPYEEPNRAVPVWSGHQRVLGLLGGPVELFLPRITERPVRFGWGNRDYEHIRRKHEWYFQPLLSRGRVRYDHAVNASALSGPVAHNIIRLDRLSHDRLRWVQLPNLPATAIDVCKRSHALSCQRLKPCIYVGEHQNRIFLPRFRSL